MRQPNRLPVFTAFIFVLFFYSCATSEDTVIVVDDAPRMQTEQESDAETDSEPFREITIGLIDPVTNFDPLFARSLSEKRVVSLIYDGLLALDKNGDPVPSVAKEIEQSDDGLVYTITINRDLFYHDSPVFPAGIGRRIHAADVKWAFERTARSSVPPNAGELLMNVRGYENYYLEQRTLYDNDKRVIQEVSGVQVQDQETVLIELIEPDSLFMEKLASPFLSVYPREAVVNNPETLAKNPVGTGHYMLSRVGNDGKIYLSRNDSENGRNRPDKPGINQIEVMYYGQESQLFQDFARGNIDWIPEIGPEIKEQVMSDNNELDSSYEGLYEITVYPNERVTAFYLNPRSAVDTSWLRSRLSMLTSEDFIRGSEVTLNTEEFEMDEEAEPREQYYVMLTNNFYARSALSQLHNLVFQPESSLAFFDIRVPTRATAIFTESRDSVHNLWSPISSDYWLRINSKIVSLTYRHIKNVPESEVPWGLFLNEIVIDENN